MTTPAAEPSGQQPQPAAAEDYSCHMTLAQFNRRKTMLELHYAGGLNYGAMQQLAEETHVNVDSVRRDWDRRQNWEGLIWRMSKGQADPVPILNRMEIAEENALRLIQTAKQESVQVAALKAYPAIVAKKMELLQALGRLPKLEPGTTVEVNNYNTTNVVEHAQILQQFTEPARRAGAANAAALRPGEPIHSPRQERPPTTNS